MESLITARVAPLEEGHRKTTAILDRFERVLIGDVAYKQEGIVDQVKRHDDVIDGWNDKFLELSGGFKAATWAGGIIFTLLTILHMGFECWLYIHGNGNGK